MEREKNSRVSEGTFLSMFGTEFPYMNAPQRVFFTDMYVEPFKCLFLGTKWYEKVPGGY
jgi:hypothetical protein